MRSIGGFFGLEPGRSGGCYHEGALALWNGRACLRATLEARRPRRALVPFFICDSALSAFEAARVPYSFYGVTPSLDPQLPDSADEDAVLYVNYFGLKTAAVRELVSMSRGQVIADDTQAFFERGHEGAASFNSARKFFGVPDGAYAYGAGLGISHVMPNEAQDCQYLLNRLSGRDDLAYRQYVEHERTMTTELRMPSVLAGQLLAAIDYGRVRDVRRQNFAAVHERLGHLNRLTLDLSRSDAVPYCYPFLPRTRIERERLWRREVFVPQLWPEVETRAGGPFSWERELAASLLPLPIDQRCGLDDMDRLCATVEDLT